MSAEFAHLTALAPAWAVRLADSAEHSDWLAAPPLPSGARVGACAVRIWCEEGYLKVAECQPGTMLPAFCPELHLNPDSSFCLDRRMFRADDPGRVSGFWQGLGEYLINQNQTARRGFWPAGRWLSHGPTAADKQIEAETAAAAIGIADEYAAWLEAGEGWLAGPLPALHPRTGKLLLRGAACPRGCRGDDGAAIPMRSCKHRAAMSQLIQAELHRRAAQDRFFASLRRQGKQCCGRIAGCPLAIAEAA